METDIRKIKGFYPDYRDEMLSSQIKDITDYCMNTTGIEFVFDNQTSIKENDFIVFMVKLRPMIQTPGVERKYIKQSYDGVNYTDKEGVPFFFVTRFLFETKTDLYFYHGKEIKKIRLFYLDKIDSNGEKPYKKFVSITFQQEAENA